VRRPPIPVQSQAESSEVDESAAVGVVEPEVVGVFVDDEYLGRDLEDNAHFHAVMMARRSIGCRGARSGGRELAVERLRPERPW